MDGRRSSGRSGRTDESKRRGKKIFILGGGLSPPLPPIDRDDPWWANAERRNWNDHAHVGVELGPEATGGRGWRAPPSGARISVLTN